MPGVLDGATARDVPWSAATRVSFRVALLFGILSLVHLTPFAAQYLYFPGAVQTFNRWIEPLSGAEFRTLRAVGASVIKLWTGESGTSQQIAQRHSYPVCYAAAVITIALIGGFLWTGVDRRPRAYPSLNRWLRVYARYALGLTMLIYATVKVVPTQFGFLTPGDLLKPLGGLSRFWVLWNFMAVSTGYTVFTGLAELLGSVLLLFRRTTAVGALLVGAALTNVLALDIAYGVIGPAMLAAILLGLDIIIIAPYLAPLGKVFVLSRAERLPDEPMFAVARWRYAPIVKVAILLVLIAVRVSGGIQQRRTYFGAGQGLYGVFDVESFVRRGALLTPLTTDSHTWKRIASDGRYGSPELAVVFANGEIKQYKLSDDVDLRRWILSDMDKRVGTLTYSTGTGDSVILRGELGPDPVELSLRRVDLQSFPLMRTH